MVSLLLVISTPFNVWADSTLTSDFFTTSGISNFTVNDNVISGTTGASTGNFYFTGTSGSTFSFEFTRTQSSYSRYILEIPSSATIDSYSVSDGITLSGRQFIIASGVTSGAVSVKFTQSSSAYVNFSAAGNASSLGSNNFTFTFTDFVVDGVDYIGGNAPVKSPYSIQNGWLTVIDLGTSGSSYEFVLSTQFNVNSGLISQNWSETSQAYWFSNTLPVAGNSYENNGIIIEWERGEPRNIFGQTKYGIYNLTGTSSGRYLYILNPFYRTIADSEHPTIVNYPMTINGLAEGQQAYIYEVTATATVTGIVNAISTTTIDGVTSIANWGTTSGGAISSDLTNTFINPDTDTSTIQTQGGGNSNEVAQTITDYLQQIQNVLDSFVEQVLGLLSAPISHIQQLISTGSDFMSTLGDLFSWLPAPVISVIVSALIVMVVIGVLKMFL